MIPLNWKQLYLKRNAIKMKGFLSLQAVQHNNRSQIDTYIIMHFNMNTEHWRHQQQQNIVLSFSFWKSCQWNAIYDRLTVCLHELCNNEIFQIHLRVFFFFFFFLVISFACSLTLFTVLHSSFNCSDEISD